MSTTLTRHRPRVMRELRDYGMRYQVRCTCGEFGPERAQRRVAADDRTYHIEAIAAPLEVRCQRTYPREHGVAWWEFCQLCSYQPSLFDDEFA